MLCNTCQRQQNCLPAALATDDTKLRTLLERLKGCDRHVPMSAPKTESNSGKRSFLQLLIRHPA